MKASKTVIGILAHVDAGKTTLSEGLLYTAGVLRKLGRVDHRDAFLDNFALERERGITIFSKQANLSWKGLELVLLDTPGHVDFSAVYFQSDRYAGPCGFFGGNGEDAAGFGLLSAGGQRL